MKKKCECEEDKESCLATHTAGYMCTRNPKHKGKHVACGIYAQHNIVSWKNEDKKTPKA